MPDGVGLSVGASNLAAVLVGRAAVSRTPVLTRYPHRPPEVGVPSENPNLNERGLILTDFVDRVGDPVDIVAADGSTHRADGVLADALRAMLHAVGGGRPSAEPVAVTYPAHWRQAAVDALRNALAAMPEFQGPTPASVVSDADGCADGAAERPGCADPGRHRAVRLRWHRYAASPWSTRAQVTRRWAPPFATSISPATSSIRPC